MVVFLSIIYVLVCFFLVVSVLLQEGKGGGVSSAFGAGGAGQTLFGAGGAGNFLTKATSILGGAFMLFSLLLALVSSSPTGNRKRSVLQPTGAPVTSQPAAVPPGASQVPGSPVGSTPAAGGPSTPVPGEVPAPAPAASGGTGN